MGHGGACFELHHGYLRHNHLSTSILLSVHAIVMLKLMGIKYRDAPRHVSQYRGCVPQGTNEVMKCLSSLISGKATCTPTSPRTL